MCGQVVEPSVYPWHSVGVQVIVSVCGWVVPFVHSPILVQFFVWFPLEGQVLGVKVLVQFDSVQGVCLFESEHCG